MPCIDTNTYTGMRLMSIDFRDKVEQPPPIIISMGFSHIMNHDAIINVTFPSKTEDGALIYCQAYKIGNEPSSNTALMLANNVATISSAYASLSIPNLLAITNYDIYCVTISSEVLKCRMRLY